MAVRGVRPFPSVFAEKWEEPGDERKVCESTLVGERNKSAVIA